MIPPSTSSRRILRPNSTPLPALNRGTTWVCGSNSDSTFSPAGTGSSSSTRRSAWRIPRSSRGRISPSRPDSRTAFRSATPSPPPPTAPSPGSAPRHPRLHPAVRRPPRRPPLLALTAGQISPPIGGIEACQARLVLRDCLLAVLALRGVEPVRRHPVQLLGQDPDLALQ